MLLVTPRLVLAGLSGDSGKTLVALGLARALMDKGLTVAPFKKGPDYIDAAWLGAAAGRPGRNLDTFLMETEALGEALVRGGRADLVLVEGNRGLFDGLNAAGTHSTAELARKLRAPVVLIVDVAKTTRTVAALVLGCMKLDSELNIGGVILNRVGTPRQERVIREALAAVQAPPVVGAVPRLEGEPLPGRHLGLVTAAEHPHKEHALGRVAEAVARSVDMDAIMTLARSAAPVEFPERAGAPKERQTKVAVFRDESISFYYPENLEALEEAGAELTFVSPLMDTSLPEVDAAYIGGGFPEVHAERLADNRSFRDSVSAVARQGLPIFAECGGLMYLGKELVVDDRSYPMTGVLDFTVEQTKKPRGHGYVMGEVDAPNPYFETGSALRGHEFHYSRVVGGRDRRATVVSLARGSGIADGRDGISVGRVWASYVHLHALGTPTWAPSLVALGQMRRQERNEIPAACG